MTVAASNADGPQRNPEIKSHSIALIGRFGLSLDPFSWNFQKVFLAAQGAAAVIFLWFAYHIPPPGFAIGVLGVTAAVMAFRVEAPNFEKMAWLFVIFGLMFVEIKAIAREHQRQETTFQIIIRQGVETLQAVNTLQNVKPAESSPVQITSPAQKTRSFVAIVPDRLGIDRGKLFVNVICENSGIDLVTLRECGAVLFLYDGGGDVFYNDKKRQEEYFQSFLKEEQKKPAKLSKTLIPGDNVWFSPTGPVATQDLIAQLNGSQKLLVAVGRAVYTDNQGTHRNDLCKWLQPPVTSQPPAWHACLVHDGEQ